MQYGASLSRELPGAINLTVGYTGSQGKDMFLRGVGNVLDPVTRARLVPNYGQIDFKTAGCVDDLALGGVYPTDRLRHAPATTPCSSARRAASAPASAAALNYQVLAQHAARRRARTKRGRRRTPSTSRPNTASTRRTSRTPSTAR